MTLRGKIQNKFAYISGSKRQNEVKMNILGLFTILFSKV